MTTPYIADSTILIDFLEINLVAEFFNMDLNIKISELVFAEITNEEQLKKLNQYRKNYNIKFFDEKEIDEINKLFINFKGLSMADRSSLFIALCNFTTILSGDKLLRDIAKKLKIPVHGTLWIFDKMIENKIIDCKTAIKKLSLLMKINSRLPKDECIKRIHNWQTKNKSSGYCG